MRTSPCGFHLIRVHTYLTTRLRQAQLIELWLESVENTHVVDGRRTTIIVTSTVTPTGASATADQLEERHGGLAFCSVHLGEG